MCVGMSSRIKRARASGREGGALERESKKACNLESEGLERGLSRGKDSEGEKERTREGREAGKKETEKEREGGREVRRKMERCLRQKSITSLKKQRERARARGERMSESLRKKE